MKNRPATLLASALIAAVTTLALPLTAQVVNTPVVATPFVSTPIPGVAPLQTPFFQGVPSNATIPRVVPELSVPRPLQTDVDPSLRQIRITFDQPMDVALFFWPLPTDNPFFPAVTGLPFWTNGNRTVVLPVVLAPGRLYHIPINTPTLVFRGSTGLYANPGLFQFETRSQAQGGTVNIGRTQTVPVVRQTVAPVAPPLVGGRAGQSGAGSSAPAGTIGASPARVTPAAGVTRQSTHRSSNSPLQNRRATPAPTPRR